MVRSKAMIKTLEPGDTVEVYLDPITCERLIGVARLLRKAEDIQDFNGWKEHTECWYVRFLGKKAIELKRINKTKF
jgi:hypothetical protein